MFVCERLRKPWLRVGILVLLCLFIVTSILFKVRDTGTLGIEPWTFCKRTNAYYCIEACLIAKALIKRELVVPCFDDDNLPDMDEATEPPLSEVSQRSPRSSLIPLTSLQSVLSNLG